MTGHRKAGAREVICHAKSAKRSTPGKKHVPKKRPKDDVAKSKVKQAKPKQQQASKTKRVRLKVKTQGGSLGTSVEEEEDDDLDSGGTSDSDSSSSDSDSDSSSSSSSSASAALPDAKVTDGHVPEPEASRSAVASRVAELSTPSRASFGVAQSPPRLQGTTFKAPIASTTSKASLNPRKMNKDVGIRVAVVGDGWGGIVSKVGGNGGVGGYEAVVTEADDLTFTVVAVGCWEETHVLRACCIPVGEKDAPKAATAD